MTFLAIPIGLGNGFNDDILYFRIIRANQTWVAPISGDMDVMLIGGHGGGGCARSSSSTTSLSDVYTTTGAGAGETAIKLSYHVVAGSSYTITIGYPGGAASAITTSSYTAKSGGSGGESKFVGPGINMNAKAGAGAGSAWASNDAAGGEGGYGGTGGSYHFPGGNGGSSDINGNWNGVVYPTGSGSVNLTYGYVPGTLTNAQIIKLTELTRGGNRYYPSGFGSSINIGPTGGGGCGGTGGDQLGSVTNGATTNTGGGGAGGDGAVITGTSINTVAFGGPDANMTLPATAIIGNMPVISFKDIPMRFCLAAIGGGTGALAANTDITKPGGGGRGGNGANLNATKAGFMGGMGGAYIASAAITGHAGTNLCSPGQSVASIGATATVVQGGEGDSGLCIIIIRKPKT